MYCNIVTARCVECLNHDHCDPGLVCLANGTCGAGNTGCANNFDCSPLVCNPTTGACVQCMLNSDCPAGDVCLNNACDGGDPGCTSQAQCDAYDLVCNPATGQCDTCAASRPCPNGKYCDGTGHCVDCLNAGHCALGYICSGGACIPDGGGGALGDPCTTHAECAAGHVCLGSGGSGICSRPCIGSGKGGDADCPLGFACQNFESGGLDGLMLCNTTTQLASDYPGQPFDLAPGAACASRNGCQTSVCYASGCAHQCAANRDCAANEVCYALPAASLPGTQHHCFYSDTVNFLPTGAACADSAECDTGVCVGECWEGGACGFVLDCLLGCEGTCRDHCRSNADCAVGQSCNPWPMDVFTPASFVPICLPKYFSGTQADGTSCSADGNCASDWCVGGICTTPCGISADCTGALAGTFCEPLSFVDDTGTPVYAMAFCL